MDTVTLNIVLKRFDERFHSKNFRDYPADGDLHTFLVGVTRCDAHMGVREFLLNLIRESGGSVLPREEEPQPKQALLSADEYLTNVLSSEDTGHT